MAADDRHGVNGGPHRSSPLFNEEAEEVARPVVPLGGARDEETVVRPRRGRLSRNVVLALAVVAASTVGAAAGYLAHTRHAPEPAAGVTAGAAAEQAPPPPAVSNSPETSLAAPAARRAQGRPQAQVEAERPEPKEESEGRAREEGERAEGMKKEEERRREREKDGAERLREVEKKIAERLRDEGKKIAERHRDEKKGEKPKARLVDMIVGGARPF